MWTGTSALRNIDQSLQSIRNDVVRLDSQLARLTSQLASKERQRAKLLNDIASVRLSEIESGELHANYTAADRESAELLDQRERALKELNARIEAINERISEAEGQRDLLLKTVNDASDEIVEAEGQVQASLASDKAYLVQLENAQRAESIAEEAQRKTQQAQENMAEKAKPYQEDGLFMYLWNRGYGTTEYRAGPFSRFMDSWVAKVIKYEASRVNYWNLMAIPERLNEHAERVGDTADEQHMLLQQLEMNALESAGVTSLEAELASLRLQLDAHDDTIEELESKLNEYLEQRALYASGGDDYIQKCLQRISTSLEHSSLQSIHRYVKMTVSPTDDQLVLELQELEDSLDGAEDDLSDVRALHDGKLSRLKDLEKVRRDFKNSRFDDVRSGFGNQALITGVLAQFLQGVVSGSDVWRVIKRNQRYRKVASAPDFGSGGFGEIADILGDELLRQGRRQRRSRRGSTWHWPKSRSGGGGFRMPRSGGGSGGGGFKTGGGF